MTKSAFEDSPPLTDRVNAYDVAHLATCLRLLDAAEEGADWREVVRIVFGLDPPSIRIVPGASTTHTLLGRAG